MPASASTSWLPLVDAVAGEWAEYQTLDQHRLRYEVTEVSTLGVRARVTVSQAGRNWGEPAVREDDRAFDPLSRDTHRDQFIRRVEPCTVEEAGRSWQALLFEDRWMDEDTPYLRRTWVSRDAPYLGTLRMQLYGGGNLEASLILTVYGVP